MHPGTPLSPLAYRSRSSVPARAGLASYDPVPVEVAPSVPAYTFSLAALSNSEALYLLSADQQAALEADGFVIVFEGFAQIYQVYQAADRRGLPSFVTVDALLHAFHILFNWSLRSVEADFLSGELEALSETMVAAASAQYQELTGEFQAAAEQNLAFFSVGALLLRPDFPPPEAVARVVREEVTLISAHDGVYISPLRGQPEDYTQYAPRGHYTRNELLERYFQAMTWYGRAGFRLETPEDPAVARRETRQALLILTALYQAELDGAPARESWARIYEPTSFFVEGADDLTVYDYAAAVQAIYGRLPAPDEGLEQWGAALDDEGKLSDLMVTLATFRAPRILGGPLTDAEVEANGGPPMQFRFMGQRFVPDSALFQALVYNSVGLYQGDGEPFTLSQSEVGPIRGLPRGLDVAAVFGSAAGVDHFGERGGHGL